MIGRGAVGNPWIFSRMDREEVPDALVFETIRQHLGAMIAFYGERGVITFRKYLKAYLQPYALPPEQLRALLTSKDPAFILKTLERYFESRLT
jgi:tRNA-dihydrouridine synthase B